MRDRLLNSEELEVLWAYADRIDAVMVEIKTEAGGADALNAMSYWLAQAAYKQKDPKAAFEQFVKNTRKLMNHWTKEDSKK